MQYHRVGLASFAPFDRPDGTGGDFVCRFSIQVLTTPICCLIITYCGAAQTGGAEIKEFLAGESLAVLVVHIQLCERVARP